MHAPLALALALLPCLAGAGVPVRPDVAPPTRLQDVTVKDQNGALLLRLKTAGPAKYRATFLEAPYRLVIDLEDTVYAWRKTPLVVAHEPVQQIRGGQYRTAIARVVVELTRKAGYVVRADDDGLAIIVPTTAVAAATPRLPVKAPFLALTALPTANDPKMPGETPSAPIADATAERTLPPADTAAPATTTARPAPEPATRRVQVAQATPPRAPARPPLISLEFKDADIVNLLRTLAAEAGRNIIIGDDVKGKMSISLRNVPLDLALQTILEARGLERIDRDGVVRIVTREQYTKEVESTVKMREAAAKLAEAAQRPEPRGPLREETVRLYYTDAEEVAKTLQGILGLGAGGPARPSGAVAGPIAEAPFSQLFGPGQAPAAEAPQLVAPDTLAKGLTIRAHKPTNTLFLRLYQSDLERVKKLIRESLDIPLPQVKIEARMEILDRSALEQIGIQWGGATAQPAGRPGTIVGSGFGDPRTGGLPVAGLGTQPNQNLVLNQGLPVSSATGLPLGGNLVNLPITALPTASGSPTAGLAFGIIGTRYNINLALQALSSQGKTRTLARPEVVTVENNKATMSLGEEIPYATISSAGTQIQFKEALLKLEVTPTVIREGDVVKIKLSVVVENNSRGDVVNLGTAGSPPAINRRKAETQVIIREGDRLIIGGVINATQVNTIRKVPIFGDIPLLGWLFKQREESETGRELVVFLTPTVLRTIDGVGAAGAMPAAGQK